MVNGKAHEGGRNATRDNVDRWIEVAEAHRIRLLEQQMSAHSIAPQPNSLVKKMQSMVRLQISYCRVANPPVTRLAG